MPRRRHRATKRAARWSKPRQTTGRPVVDNAAVAHALFGPIHSLVAQLAHHRTAYAITHQCNLDKRAVDSAVAGLLEFGLLRIDGVVLSRASLRVSDVYQCFGKKFGAHLVVWPDVAKASARARHRRRQPQPGRRD